MLHTLQYAEDLNREREQEREQLQRQVQAKRERALIATDDDAEVPSVAARHRAGSFSGRIGGSLAARRSRHAGHRGGGVRTA